MSCQSDESSDASDNESESEGTSKKPKPVNNNGLRDSATSNRSQTKSKGLFSSMFGSMLENHPLLKSIDGRAASVHNFMRGLSLYKAYPFSPFTSLDGKRNEDKLSGM